MKKVFRYMTRKSVLFLALQLASLQLFAQAELLKYADFESWITRDIKESALMGGKTKRLYEVGPEGKFDGAKPFFNQGGSPWANSNVYAKVCGIVKTNCSVFPDEHDGGKCVKLTSRIEKCKAIGIVNITVLAAGSMFTGTMVEPITGTSNPMSKINVGIPFTRKPKALQMDYKVYLPEEPNRIKETGFGKRRTVEGPDMCEVVCLLQKRWEDAEGNLYAKRVGTLRMRFDKSTDGWQEDKQFNIHYGDISKESWYRGWMGPVTGERTYYALNSQGENVPIHEEGWASADENPTHLILKFDSSYGGAYIGTPGATLWIDNVKMVY